MCFVSRQFESFAVIWFGKTSGSLAENLKQFIKKNTCGMEGTRQCLHVYDLHVDAIDWFEITGKKLEKRPNSTYWLRKEE